MSGRIVKAYEIRHENSPPHDVYFVDRKPTDDEEAACDRDGHPPYISEVFHGAVNDFCPRCRKLWASAPLRMYP